MRRKRVGNLWFTIKYVAFLVILTSSLIWAIYLIHERTTERFLRETKRQNEVINQYFKKIQRYHGVAIVSTDFSHFIRLNGEVCKLKSYEKPPMYR
jgi:hypothetical protein